jgi:hypothetical protein
MISSDYIKAQEMFIRILVSHLELSSVPEPNEILEDRIDGVCLNLRNNHVLVFFKNETNTSSILFDLFTIGVCIQLVRR